MLQLQPDAGTGSNATDPPIAREDFPGTVPDLDALGIGTHAVNLDELYEVGVQIGRGGMAEIHAAVDRATGEQVAVKRIIPGLAVRTRIRMRFANEIDLLQRCRGPYVLRLIAAGVSDDTPAYVSERCVGSLYDLGKDRPLPLSRVLGLSSEVLVALDRVHAAGGVHRDIKPSNILVGRDGAARLADFGIARHPLNRLTGVGHRVGTPAFAAPDLQADPRLAAPAHDLYSVGLLVLTLSTHLKPRALTDPTERARTLRLFPEATAQLLAKATAPNPTARFTSAAEMALAVQRAIAQL